MNLPLEFTSKILQTLTRSGICESKRRKEGDSILTLTQEQILLKDIIEIMDGEISVIACLKKDFVDCWQTHFCSPIIRKISEVKVAINNTLTNVNFQEMIVRV